MNPKAVFNLFKQTFKEWSEDKAARLGASLAYYTIFSLGPLLVIVISIASIVFKNAREQITGTIGGVAGSGAADMINQTIDNANKGGANIIAAVIGIVTLLFGAAGVFGNLKDSLNTMWEVQPKPGGGIMNMLKQRFLSFTMVLGTGFLLLVSLVISAMIAALGVFLKSILPGADIIAQIANVLVGLGIITVMFALLFKFVPDGKIAWSDVWVGSLVTAILFMVGQAALAFYLQSGAVGKSFGAASSVIVILVWIYYSAQILFFGAEFTQVYANSFGSRVKPASNAEFVTDEARAQQGIPRDGDKPGAEGEDEKHDKEERPARERARNPRPRRAMASPWFK